MSVPGCRSENQRVLRPQVLTISITAMEMSLAMSQSRSWRVKVTVESALTSGRRDLTHFFSLILMSHRGNKKLVNQSPCKRIFTPKTATRKNSK